MGQLVIEAIKDVPGVCYSVILNKLPKKMFKQVQTEEGHNKIMAMVMHKLEVKSTRLWPLPVIKELEDAEMDPDAEEEEDRTLKALPAEFLQWIAEAPAVFVSSEQVEDVKEDEFERIEQEHQQQITEMNESLEKQQQAMKEMEADLQE